MSVKRKLTAALGVCLLSIGVGAFVAATPAQAAIGACPQYDDRRLFCLYEGSHFTGTAYAFPGDTIRGQCINVAYFDWNSVWNATSTRWYLFHTTSCDGSHAEIAPNWEGNLPAGYDRGQTNGIMRTSSTS